MKSFQYIIIVLFLSIQSMHGMEEEEYQRDPESQARLEIFLRSQAKRRELEVLIQKEEEEAKRKEREQQAPLDVNALIRNAQARSLVVEAQSNKMKEAKRKEREETESSNMNNLEQEVSEITKEPHAYTPRALLIYLDDTETAPQDAICSSLQNAINREAGPIIASLHCLKLIYQDTSSEEIKNKLNASWIIKEITQPADDDHPSRTNMALLMPLSYLNKIGINRQDFEKSDASDITNTELALGLKANHMQTQTLNNLHFPHYNLNQSSYYFLQTLYNANTKTSNIFCVRSDYKEYKESLPIWSIYTKGHGSTGQYNCTIIGIDCNDFKKVLDFLNTKINTRLLVYESCYAAGTNTEAIYRDPDTALLKNYSFPIITFALTDAPTSSSALFEEPEKFVAAVMAPTSNTINYKEIIKYLNTSSESETTPQIKLPGLDWFSVINADKNIVQIGSILASKRGNRPLDIVKFFRNEPTILLLYAPNIPFELIINSKNLQSIVSMLPGNALHMIEKVTSKSSPRVVLDWFMSITMLGTEKVFYIKTLNDLKDVIIINKPYGTNEYEQFALFKKDGILYVKENLKGSKYAPTKYWEHEEIKEVKADTHSIRRPEVIYSEAMYQAILLSIQRIIAGP